MAARQNLGSVLVVCGCGFLGHRIVAQLIDSDATTKISVLDLKIDRNRNPNVSYMLAIYPPKAMFSPSSTNSGLKLSSTQHPLRHLLKKWIFSYESMSRAHVIS